MHGRAKKAALLTLLIVLVSFHSFMIALYYITAVYALSECLLCYRRLRCRREAWSDTQALPSFLTALSLTHLDVSACRAADLSVVSDMTSLVTLSLQARSCLCACFFGLLAFELAACCLRITQITCPVPSCPSRAVLATAVKRKAPCC